MKFLVLAAEGQFQDTWVWTRKGTPMSGHGPLPGNHFKLAQARRKSPQKAKV